MSKVAVITDSNSGITQSQAKELGIRVLPMPFNIGEKTYFEDIDLTQDQFYEMLGDGTDIATSQPSPEKVLDLWDERLRNMMRSFISLCPAACPAHAILQKCWQQIMIIKYG